MPENRWWQADWKKKLAESGIDTLLYSFWAAILGLALAALGAVLALVVGSSAWTNRAVGALIALLYLAIAAGVLWLLRWRRVKNLNRLAQQPLAAKGFLDHLIDRDRATKSQLRLWAQVTALMKHDGETMEGLRKRIERANMLPASRRVRKGRRISHRAARLLNRSRAKLDGITPALQGAAELFGESQIAYLEWYKTKGKIASQEVDVLRRAITGLLETTRHSAASQDQYKQAVLSLQGITQRQNEAASLLAAALDRLLAAGQTTETTCIRLLDLLGT